MGKYLISQGIDSNKLLNFPNGTNLNLFKSKKYPPSLNNPKYVYIGDMGIRRKLDKIIYSMTIVTEQFKDAHLFMVGEGTEIENLKKLTKKLDLEKNITFTGQIPYEKVPEYIYRAHIALCPIPPTYTFKLSTPYKLFEYMSCSRPVIANKEIPTHFEAIKKSRGGILVDYNPKSFAKAMIKLFQNPKESEEMGIRGRKWVEQNRTYEKFTLDLEKRILKLLK